MLRNLLDSPPRHGVGNRSLCSAAKTVTPTQNTLGKNMLISVYRLARPLMEDRVRCWVRTLTVKLPTFLYRRNGSCRRAASTSSHPQFRRSRKRSHWQHRNLNFEFKELLAHLSFRLWTYCGTLGQSMRMVNL